MQDIRVGGRASKAQFQYALQSGSLDNLNLWAPRLVEKLRKMPELRDVNSDQQTGGLQANVEVDRDAAARLGITVEAIDNTLYDAFGQRQVSTIYERYNQHHVVMEVDPNYLSDPSPSENLSSNRQTDVRCRFPRFPEILHLERFSLRQSPGAVPGCDPLLQPLLPGFR